MVFRKTIFWLLFFPICGQAGLDQICDQLYRFSCAPGNYDDGTGSARNPDPFVSVGADMRGLVARNSKARFQKLFEDPENVYFRKSALSATGLVLHPSCEGAETKPSPECMDMMLKGGVDIVLKRQFSAGTGAQDVQAPVSDLDYFTNSEEFAKLEEGLKEDFKKDIGIENLNRRVQDKVFPQIKNLLVVKIDKMVVDEKVKKNLKDKVKAIHYIGSDCSKDQAGGGGGTIAGTLTPNAFYDPTKNTFKYCAGFSILNQSEFQIAETIGHELAHSLDPCGIAAGPSDYAFKYSAPVTRLSQENDFPFYGVLNCLRGEKSLAARPGKRIVYSGGYLMGGAAQPASPSPETEDNQPIQCGVDQITEGFADWMSAEILPDYIETNFPKLTQQQKRFGYSNVWRGSCGDSPPPMSDPHSNVSLRVDHLLLVQPKIRSQMGCGPTAPDKVYCPVSSSKPSEAKPFTDVNLVSPETGASKGEK